MDVSARARAVSRFLADQSDTPPVVVPLSPGERPTEPGWYVVSRHAQLGIVEVGGVDPIWFEVIGIEGRDYAEVTFIARIYPDRIEGRED